MDGYSYGRMLDGLGRMIVATIVVAMLVGACCGVAGVRACDWIDRRYDLRLERTDPNRSTD